MLSLLYIPQVVSVRMYLHSFWGLEVLEDWEGLGRVVDKQN